MIINHIIRKDHIQGNTAVLVKACSLQMKMNFTIGIAEEIDRIKLIHDKTAKVIGLRQRGVTSYEARAVGESDAAL